jgi:hypothetical protein
MPTFISDYILCSGTQIPPPDTPSSDINRLTDELPDSGESGSSQSFALISSPPSSSPSRLLPGGSSPVSSNGSRFAPMLGRDQTSRVRDWRPPSNLERGGQWRRTKTKRSFAYYHGVRVRDLQTEQDK